MLPDLKSIGRRRKALSLTQKQVAMATQISQSLITKIERGNIIPSYEIAKRIFIFLDSAERKNEKFAKDMMQKNVIVLDASDKISKAISLIKKHSVSQFPVIKNKAIVGSISTKEIMDAPKKAEVNGFLTDPFPTIGSETPASIVKDLLKHHSAVLIIKNSSIEGIITAEDFL